MSKEQPQSNDLTLEAMAQTATEIMQDKGDQVTVVLVVGRQQRYAVVIETWRETQPQCLIQMFELGYALAEKTGTGDLERVVLVNGAWLSLPKGGLLPDVRPSHEHNCKDVLMVYEMDVARDTSRMMMFARIHDPEGHIRELKEVMDPQTHDATVENPLLRGFVTGYGAATQHRRLTGGHD